MANLSCKCKIFADDIKLYLSFEVTDSSGVASLQADIDRVVTAGMSWNLKLNPDKCVVLRFLPQRSQLPSSGNSPYTVGNKNLKFVDSHSDLGVTIDRSLKFHNHIRHRVAVAGALTTNLLSSTLCRSPEFIMNIYCSQIRPQLEYGSHLWNTGFVGDLKLLERIQRRWTRAVVGLEDKPYNERLDALNLFSFRGRLLRQDMIMVWKIFHNLSAIAPSDLFTPSCAANTRGHPLKIQVQQTRLDVNKRFFSNRVVSTWNSLAADTVLAANVDTFKSRLHRDLGEQLYQFY